jgi:hypothetical protein
MEDAPCLAVYGGVVMVMLQHHSNTVDSFSLLHSVHIVLDCACSMLSDPITIVREQKASR